MSVAAFLLVGYFGRFYDRRVTGVLLTFPILNVIGTETVPRFFQSAAIVQSLFPNAVRVELPGAGHLMMAQEPTAMAIRLAEFWH